MNIRNLSKIRALPALRVALLALCTSALAVPVLAQDAPPPPPQSQGGPGGPGSGGPGRGGPEQQQRQLDMMTKRLNLTPDQVTQIKAIQADGRTKMMAMRDDTSMSQDDRRSKMMAMRQDEQSKIRGVLTDDQKTQYDAMQKQMQERRGGGGGGYGGPPPPPPQL